MEMQAKRAKHRALTLPQEETHVLTLYHRFVETLCNDKDGSYSRVY